MVSSGWQQPWVADTNREWPSEVVEHLQKWVLSVRSPAFLVTDPQARLLSTGGDLVRFGLGALRTGESPLREAYFLEGLLPIDGSLSTLYRVETAAGVFADI